MEKLPLFVNCPVSESVLQAFPALEESEAFFFHALKLDSDLFALMIDARPCVAVFSIPDAASRQEICGLLENFRMLRESLGYPKRDPTLRTILVAEEKTVSLERWHDLGVHEFIIAPILPRALAYKINRHHQRAAASVVPEPYEEKEDVIVVKGSQAPHAEIPHERWRPSEKEASLSEVAHPARGLRSFLSERMGEPAKYSVITSIPELREDEGRWELQAEKARSGSAVGPAAGSASKPGAETFWGWTWNDPRKPGGSSWSFRGERPQYDPKRRAWKLSGERPLLELGRKGGASPEGARDPQDSRQPMEKAPRENVPEKIHEKIIDTIETKQGREIVVRTEQDFEVIEVKQISVAPDRPHDPAESAGARRTQRISQSQRSLERTLITERDRERKWNTDLSSPELPPELEEISKRLLEDSGADSSGSGPGVGPGAVSDPDTTPTAADAPAISGAGAVSGSGTVMSPADTSRNIESGTRGNEPLLEGNPSSPSAAGPAAGSDDPLTNPYLDVRGKVETGSPDPDTAEPGLPSGESPDGPTPTVPATDEPPAPAPASGLKSGLDPRDPAPPAHLAPNPASGNLVATSFSKPTDSYGQSHSPHPASQPPDSGFRLSSPSKAEDEKSMRLAKNSTDPNTWSMQNLEEAAGQRSRKIFETGEKPSLDFIAEQQTAEQTTGQADAGSIMGESADQAILQGDPQAGPGTTGRIPGFDPASQPPRNQAWYNLFWRRIRLLLKKIGK